MIMFRSFLSLFSRLSLFFSFFSFFFLSASFLSSVSAADAKDFLVKVTPETFSLGEPVDLEITVLLEDGETALEYDGDIFITLDHPDDSDYTVPSDGIYVFTPEDQWYKVFSKWLIINVAGEFTLLVEDILWEISGKATVVVSEWDWWASAESATVTITSPSAWTSVSSTEPLSVIGTSSSPNTPVFLLIDDVEQDTQMTTDDTGWYTVYASDLSVWAHTLAVVLKDADGKEMWKSDLLSFDVSDSSDEQEEEIDVPEETTPVPEEEEPLPEPPVEEEAQELLLSYFAQPQWPVAPWDLLTIWAITVESVISVELTIGPSTYSLDQVSPGQFWKELSLQHPWTYAVQVRVLTDKGEKSYSQDPIIIEQPIVQEPVACEGIWDSDNDGQCDDVDACPQDPDNNCKNDDSSIVWIWKIQYEFDPLDLSTAVVSWEPIGDISFYLVRHGTNPAFLDKELVVVDTWVSLTWLEPDSTVYVQVWPADDGWNTIGVPSDPLVVEVGHSAPACVVKGIKVRTEKRWNNYYLVWDKVENAKEYIVYRSDFQVSLLTEMQEIWRTREHSYHYPFDVNAAQNEYAYYAVSALCEWGTPVPLDDIKAIQVGPMTNMFAFVILAFLVYGLGRVYYLTRE